VFEMGWGWYFRPFVGTGVGGRTYNCRRVEARTTCFESPITADKRTRNAIGLTVGLAYHLR
jgi:hypothetical protein